MAHPMMPGPSQLCVWMSAGLLTYKLCDRDFDCERCPLDAGLRGGAPASPQHTALLAPGRDARVFPEDRLYANGHTWVQAVGSRDEGLLKFGLDAFAVAIIGRCREVRWRVSDRPLARGETLCEIDLGLGTLTAGAPVRCTVLDGNPTLQREPSQLVTAPYGDGWIAQLAAEPSELDGLLTAERAREKARLDLQRFRRRVALQLLADPEARSLPDGGEMLVDLRQMLGGPKYLELLRELIH